VQAERRCDDDHDHVVNEHDQQLHVVEQLDVLEHDDDVGAG
jgi:hypothetical protein